MANEIASALRRAASSLTDSGGWTDFVDPAGLARLFASSVIPLRLLAEWLDRSPEAVRALTDAIAVEGGSQPRAQTSEPDSAQAGGRVRRPFDSAGRGPVVIKNSKEAAAFLGVDQFETREVGENDMLSEIGPIRGHTPMASPDGSPIRARVRRGGHDIECVFLDKKGPMILARSVATGSVFNIPSVVIEPGMRAQVLAALSQLPDADAVYNFDPHEGTVDPWLAEVKDDPAPASGVTIESGPKAE